MNIVLSTKGRITKALKYHVEMTGRHSSLPLLVVQILDIFSRRSFVPKNMRQYIRRLGHSVSEKHLKKEPYTKQFFTVNQDETFLDVGANTGLYTMLLAPMCKNVHAREPNSQTASILKLNIERYNNVVLHVEALGKEEGTFLFYVHSNSEHDGFVMNLNKDTYVGRVVRVPVKRLDSYRFDSEKIGLMKIDVEGFEVRVLEGALETIRKHRPRLIIEIHPPHKESVKRIMALLPEYK